MRLHDLGDFFTDNDSAVHGEQNHVNRVKMKSGTVLEPGVRIELT